MRRFIVLVISVLLMFSTVASANESSDIFVIDFPSKYEKIDDNKWRLPVNFNGDKCVVEVSASVSFESAEFTEETVFSEEFLTRVKESIFDLETVDSFIDSPAEILVGDNNYRCIYATYISEVDGVRCLKVVYKFYSDSQCCTVEFVSTDLRYMVFGEFEMLSAVEKLHLDKNFFTNSEDELQEIEGENDEQENGSFSFKKINKILSSLLFFLFLFIFVFGYHTIYKTISEKEKAETTWVRFYLLKREVLRLIIYAFCTCYYCYLFALDDKLPKLFYILLAFAAYRLLRSIIRVVLILMKSSLCEIKTVRCNKVHTEETSAVGPDNYSSLTLEVETAGDNFSFDGFDISKAVENIHVNDTIIVVRFKFEKSPYMVAFVAKKKKKRRFWNRKK